MNLHFFHNSKIYFSVCFIHVDFDNFKRHDIILIKSRISQSISTKNCVTCWEFMNYNFYVNICKFIMQIICKLAAMLWKNPGENPAIVKFDHFSIKLVSYLLARALFVLVNLWKYYMRSFNNICNSVVYKTHNRKKC